MSPVWKWKKYKFYQFVTSVFLHSLLIQGQNIRQDQFPDHQDRREAHQWDRWREDGDGAERPDVEERRKSSTQCMPALRLRCRFDENWRAVENTWQPEPVTFWNCENFTILIFSKDLRITFDPLNMVTLLCIQCISIFTICHDPLLWEWGQLWMTF